MNFHAKTHTRLIVVTAITAAGAWLAAPGAAPAASIDSSLPSAVPAARDLAARDCQDERAYVGKKVFRKRYGKRNAMVRCIRRGTVSAAADIQFYADDCVEEAAEEGTDVFNTYYGSLTSGSSDPMTNCILDSLGMLPDDEYEE